MEVRIEDELIHYVNERSDRTVDPHMVKTIVYWFLSVVVNKKKRTIQVGYNSLLMNFYGLVFAKSNSGKSYILNLLLELFHKDDYEKMLNTLFDARTATLPNGEQIDTALQKKFIKAFPPIKKDSTTQAIHKAAEAINTSAETNGSFNIYSDEFFANASEPILDMLVEGHDGIYKAPMIKGKKDEEFLEYYDIEGLTTNVLGLSSTAAIMKDQKKLSVFVGEMERAWFKRSFIYFNDSFTPKAKDSSEIHKPILSAELNHLLDMSREAVGEAPRELEMDAPTEAKFNQKRMEYINGSEETRFSNLLDIYKTLKLAGILCAANFRTTISLFDWNQAMKYDRESFKQATNFCSLEHPHIRVYEAVSKGSINEHELVEAGILPGAKNVRKDILELVNQLAYKKNMRFIIAGDKVRKFSIDQLELNDLSKMIVSTSVNQSNRPEMEINFKSQEVPFFGEGMTIEALVGSGVQSYCLNHFEATDKAPDGHRRKEYVIPGQNCIAWDIDEGMSLQTAKELLSMYTYLIYTTKSHQIDKNGVICDRFRILMPTKTIYYVNAEEHKQMYTNMSEILGLTVYDIQTKNQARLWYTNPKAMVYKNKAELVDVRIGIPDTEASNAVMPNLKKLTLSDDSDELERRIYGMQKFVLTNGLAGARNEMLFRLAKFAQEQGAEMSIVSETNQMLLEPLPENEVNTIVRSL